MSFKYILLVLGLAWAWNIHAANAGESWGELQPTAPTKRMQVVPRTPVSIRNEGPRLALLLVNGNYKGQLETLPGSTRDFEIMKTTLEKVGFEVTTALDQDKEGMDRAVRSFAETLVKRGASVALFFYSGHGAQVGGRNYLIPLLPRALRDEIDIEYQTISADEIQSRLDSTKTLSRFIILDACRSNPFQDLPGARGNLAKGLAPINASQNTLIFCATGPGRIARENVFTPAFARNLLQKRGAPALEVVGATMEEVNTQTKGEQVPWLSGSSTGRVSFFPAAPTPEGQSQTPIDAPTPPNAPADWPVYVYEYRNRARRRAETIPARPTATQIYATARDFILTISGVDNRVTIREATTAYNVGHFTLSGIDESKTFYLAPGQRAHLIIWGVDNTIFVSQKLKDRVSMTQTGLDNRIVTAR